MRIKSIEKEDNGEEQKLAIQNSERLQAAARAAAMNLGLQQR